jgi:hypothetical protein
MSEDIYSPIDKFKELISNITEDPIEETEDEIKINLMGEVELTTTKVRITNIYGSLNSMKYDDATMYYDKYYESPVNFIPYYPFRSSGQFNELKKGDIYNGITYEISTPSPEYLIYIINIFKDNPNFYRGNFRRMRRYALERFCNSEHDGDLFSLIGYAIRIQPRIQTLKMDSETTLDLERFSKFANSFIFNISYNLGISVIELKSPEELLGINRISRIRRATIEEMDPPKRIYISDLVHRYQIAISTDNMQLQYLSLYQIIEHFFREIYDQHIVEEIRDRITKPGFSYNRDGDLEAIIKVIESHIKPRNAENINEKEALILTLKRYVKINDLTLEIQNHDASLVDYYNQPVAFLNKYPINLNSKSENDIFEKIASRIYGIRNSIVHSKRGEKPSCIPIKHDRYLVKEIPILRFIAEEIIINSSTGLIEIK